jgi:hypothetical protein
MQEDIENYAMEMRDHVKEIHKCVNEDEDTPREFKTIFNSLIKSFDASFRSYESYSSIFYLLYLVVKMIDYGPECVNKHIVTISDMLACEDSDGELNLFDDRGKKITLAELGIGE